MQRIFITVLLLASLMTIARAEDTQYLGYNNGQNYQKLFNDNERATYAQGFINGIAMHELFNDKQTYEAFMRCTQAMTAGRIGELIRRYIEDNPDKAGLSLSVVSIYALDEVCREKR